jgi:RNA polymerase sigma factor (sigma-70 family)
MVTTHISWWRRLRGREVSVASLPDTASWADEPGVALERAATWRLLSGLPARQRTVLVLRYWAGLSEAEIAREMGCAPGTVKTHTARGLTGVLDDRG